MPIIKSQKKRVEISAKENEANRAFRSKMNTAIKKYVATVATDVAEAEKMLPEVVSIINQAVTKGILKKNTASRKISHVSKALSDAKKA
ncbi:MAG: 30S ribosomal protein S20 [Clostridia bacterium]|nr:30S ribosomal protein S20 [Clostridia bacterium]MBR7160610.1 30S ribosomal protein S20 [Clostridia bacterium]